MTLLLAGFLIGMRHALDADHIAALSVLVADRPKVARAAAQGAAWGLGHSVTLLLVGSLVFGFDLTLSPRFAAMAELGVGVMLIALGLDLLRRWRKRQTAPSHRRALGIGLMHGLAGSSALVVLTLSTLDSSTLALSYIGLFGLGSVLGMAMLSIVLAWPLRVVSEQAGWITTATRSAASALSIGFGVVLVSGSLAAL